VKAEIRNKIRGHVKMAMKKQSAIGQVAMLKGRRQLVAEGGGFIIVNVGQN